MTLSRISTVRPMVGLKVAVLMVVPMVALTVGRSMVRPMVGLKVAVLMVVPMVALTAVRMATPGDRADL